MQSLFVILIVIGGLKVHVFWLVYVGTQKIFI